MDLYTKNVADQLRLIFENIIMQAGLIRHKMNSARLKIERRKLARNIQFIIYNIIRT